MKFCDLFSFNKLRYYLKLGNNQVGIIHLALPLLVLIIIGAVIYFLFYFGVVKNPFENLLNQISQTKEKQVPVVAVKSEYKNPFDKKSQYVNPFDQYKSPFLNLKK